MHAILFLLLPSALRDSFRGRAALQLDFIAVRHQPVTMKRISRRPADRLLWVPPSRLLPNWREMRVIVKPETVIGRHRCYATALRVIGINERQVCGRWLNNRAENSHQPFRRRERAMAKFRGNKTLQKFASVHASIHNHFNQDRYLGRRDIFKQNRAAALAEWRESMAWASSPGAFRRLAILV